MPVALGVAQISGIAQLPEFIAAILLISSVGPIQIYVNEIFAPMAVCGLAGVRWPRFLEASAGVIALTVWACYRLDLELLDYLLAVPCMLSFIWFSFGTARRVLYLQASASIGGRYSFIVGALPAIVFLLLVLVFWWLREWGALVHELLYALVLLPTLAQYGFTRTKWPHRPQAEVAKKISGAESHGDWPMLFLLIALVLAFVAQQWKIELIGLALGYAALSVYLISPISSLWLIVSKSRYVESRDAQRPVVAFWLGPLLILATLLISAASWWAAFLLAMSVQALTFKFITDVRLRLSQPIKRV